MTEPKQTWIRINGQMIRVGELAEFIREVFGANLEPRDDGRWPVLPGGLVLGLEKFKTHGHRWYSLVWLGRGKSWLAAEDQTRYRRHREAVTAGRQLSEATGAFFDEHAR